MEPRKNKKHLPDMLTDLKRKAQFNPKPGIKPLDARIEDMLHHSKSGTNFLIYKRMLRAIPKIDAIWAKKGKSKEEAHTAKATMLSRLACEYADHGVKGLRITGNINDKDLLRTLKVDPNDPNKEKRIWEYYYNGMIDCFSKDKRVATAGDIHDRMVEIDRFSGISDKLYDIRKRHWKEIGKIVNRVVGQGQNPEVNLKAEVKRILDRPRIDYAANKDTSVVRGRALDICLAASIYADVLERARGKEWPTAYTEGMLMAYPMLKEKPELVHAIAELE
ncbi:MAG: hypothetical protein AABW59_04670 [archaeon]